MPIALDKSALFLAGVENNYYKDSVGELVREITGSVDEACS